MPLQSGSSREAFEHNVKTEIAAGKPQKQAVAIAYATARGDAESREQAIKRIMREQVCSRKTAEMVYNSAQKSLSEYDKRFRPQRGDSALDCNKLDAALACADALERRLDAAERADASDRLTRQRLQEPSPGVERKVRALMNQMKKPPHQGGPKDEAELKALKSQLEELTRGQKGYGDAAWNATGVPDPGHEKGFGVEYVPKGSNSSSKKTEWFSSVKEQSAAQSRIAAAGHTHVNKVIQRG